MFAQKRRGVHNRKVDRESAKIRKDDPGPCVLYFFADPLRLLSSPGIKITT